MKRDEVEKVVRQALKDPEAEAYELRVLSLTENPVEGYWYVLVEAEAEPDMATYYQLLARLEEDLSEVEGLNVILAPAHKSSFRYSDPSDPSKIVEVIERLTTFYVVPLRSLGAERYSMIFDRGGKALTSSPEIPEDWMKRLKWAVGQHILHESKSA